MRRLPGETSPVGSGGNGESCGPDSGRGPPCARLLRRSRRKVSHGFLAAPPAWPPWDGSAKKSRREDRAQIRFALPLRQARVLLAGHDIGCSLVRPRETENLFRDGQGQENRRVCGAQDLTVARAGKRLEEKDRPPWRCRVASVAQSPCRRQRPEEGHQEGPPWWSSRWNGSAEGSPRGWPPPRRCHACGATRRCCLAARDGAELQQGLRLETQTLPRRFIRKSLLSLRSGIAWSPGARLDGHRTDSRTRHRQCTFATWRRPDPMDRNAGAPIDKVPCPERRPRSGRRSCSRRPDRGRSGQGPCHRIQRRSENHCTEGRARLCRTPRTPRACLPRRPSSWCHRIPALPPHIPSRLHERSGEDRPATGDTCSSYRCQDRKPPGSRLSSIGSGQDIGHIA